MAKSLSILSLAKPRLSSLGLPASRRTLVVLSRDIPTLVLLASIRSSTPPSSTPPRVVIVLD